MKVSYKKYDFGNGWTVGCGIQIHIGKLFMFRKWSIRKFYNHKGYSLRTEQIVLSIHKTREAANFVTGSNWVVKKLLFCYLRIQELYS